MKNVVWTTKALHRKVEQADGKTTHQYIEYRLPAPQPGSTMEQFLAELGQENPAAYKIIAGYLHTAIGLAFQRGATPETGDVSDKRLNEYLASSRSAMKKLNDLADGFIAAGETEERAVHAAREEIRRGMKSLDAGLGNGKKVSEAESKALNKMWRSGAQTWRAAAGVAAIADDGDDAGV